jgi:hypothetical protein
MNIFLLYHFFLWCTILEKEVGTRHDLLLSQSNSLTIPFLSWCHCYHKPSAFLCCSIGNVWRTDTTFFMWVYLFVCLFVRGGIIFHNAFHQICRLCSIVCYNSWESWVTEDEEGSDYGLFYYYYFYYWDWVHLVLQPLLALAWFKTLSSQLPGGIEKHHEKL